MGYKADFCFDCFSKYDENSGVNAKRSGCGQSTVRRSSSCEIQRFTIPFTENKIDLIILCVLDGYRDLGRASRLRLISVFLTHWLFQEKVVLVSTEVQSGSSELIRSIFRGTRITEALNHDRCSRLITWSHNSYIVKTALWENYDFQNSQEDQDCVDLFTLS